MKIAKKVKIDPAEAKKSPAVIPFERPEDVKLVKGQYETLKLYNDPESANSAEFELSIPYFSTGTPEQWILWKRNLNTAIKGQGLTEGTQKFALTRRLLRGEAKATFEAKAKDCVTEYTEDFDACLHSVAKGVFPAMSVKRQRRFLMKLKKRVDVPIDVFIARFQELENYMDEFPPDFEGQTGVEPHAMDVQMTILEEAIPRNWRAKMTEMGFEPTIHTMQDFKELCQRYEVTEDFTPAKKPSATAGNKGSESHGSSKTHHQEKGTKSKPGSKYCMLHGDNVSHTSADCKVLQAQAKRMKAMYDAQDSNERRKIRQKEKNHEQHVMEKLAKLEKLESKVESLFALQSKGSGKSTSKKKRARDDSDSEDDFELNMAEVDRLIAEDEFEDGEEHSRS